MFGDFLGIRITTKSTSKRQTEGSVFFGPQTLWPNPYALRLSTLALTLNPKPIIPEPKKINNQKPVAKPSLGFRV